MCVCMSVLVCVCVLVCVHYKDEGPSWFHDNMQFAQAVASAFSLPTSVRCRFGCFLEDPTHEPTTSGLGSRYQLA